MLKQRYLKTCKYAKILKISICCLHLNSNLNGSLPTCVINTQYRLMGVVRYRLKYATLILHLLLINVNVSFYP